MLVYRVIKVSYLQTALSTVGAYRNAGRWHHLKSKVLYCSSSPELALLEVIAHHDTVPLRKMEPLVMLIVETPDDLKTYQVADLPDGWNDLTDQTISRDFLRSWVEGPDTLAVAVPSVIMPLSKNIILNQLHPLSSQVELLNWEPVQIDPRIWKYQSRTRK